jgi:hypothetical protein
MRRVEVLSALLVPWPYFRVPVVFANLIGGL